MHAWLQGRCAGEIPAYDGGGANPNVAASFHPVESPEARQYTDWIGNYLFYRPVGDRHGEGYARRG